MAKKTKGKLHELLAVERGLETTAKKVVMEAHQTLTKKTEHFRAHLRTYKPYNDGEVNDQPDERREMVETVLKKLDYTWASIAQALNAIVQKECTNSSEAAKADIIFEDGTVFATDVPATALLALEKRLPEYRSTLELHVPTLPPGEKWEPDDDAEFPGVYKLAAPKVAVRKRKTLDHKILVKATEHHPAQVESFTKEEPIGQYEQFEWNSMITPAEKSKRLAKLDSLIVAIKKARVRANEATVVSNDLGTKIHQYMMAD